MSWADAAAVVLFFGVVAYALFGGADFGAGFWDLTAGGAERGARPRALVDHSIGPVWEANHVWLIFCLVVLWTAFAEAFASITLTLFVPLTLAAFGIVIRGIELRVPQGGVHDARPAELRRRVRVVVGARAVLHGRGRRRDRIGPGPGGREGRRPVGQLDQPDVDPRRGARGRDGRVPRRGLPHLGRPPLRGRRDGRVLPAPRDRRRRSSPAPWRSSGIFVLRADARYVFDGLTSRALPIVIISAICGIGSLVLLIRNSHHLARGCSRPARSPRS